MRLLRSARNDVAICILLLFPLPASAQFTDKTFDAAFLSLKDGINKVDSLNKLCRTIDDDGKAIACGIKVMELSEKLNYKKGVAQALNNIGVAYYNLDEGRQALEYHRRALYIREELLEQVQHNPDKIGDEIGRWKKDIAASYTNIGNAYDNIGNKKKAIEYHTQSLNFKREIKDTLAMAKSLNNIASAYLDIPDYYMAIDYGFKAVKLYDAIGEKSAHLAKALNNIGIAYERLKDFDKALDYYGKSLVIQKKLENKREIANLIDNIAIIYHLQGQLSKKLVQKNEKFRSAIDYYYKALVLAGSDDNELTALIFNNIGNTYWELNDFPNAFNALNKSLDIYKKLDNKSGIASTLNSLAAHFKLQKNYKQSIKYGLQALSIADSIQDMEQIKNACEILSNGYRETKQFEKALSYYTRYAEEKEKLINVEGAKELAQKESKIEFEKQEQKMKAEQEKERFKAKEKSRTQKIIIWSVVGGLLLVVVFSIFVLNRWRITQRQKKIIEAQKEEVDKQRELADSRRIIAEEQKYVIEKSKKEIEEKNKDITASINYARRIQRAMLPHRRDILKAFPQSFVLFKPKDIVSGDFYFFHEVPLLSEGGNSGVPALNPPSGDRGAVFIAAADCTGHGVPGAFMSMLVTEKLYDAVQQTTNPGEILQLVNRGVKKSLHQSEEEDTSRDGMDIVLVSIKFQSPISKPQGNTKDDSNRETWDLEFGSWVLQYAGANRPLWIVRNTPGSVLEEIKATKTAIGGFTPDEQVFDLHEMELNKGDTFYIFSDGYVDQFNAMNKKLMTKKFKEILMSIRDKSMQEQKEYLGSFLENWKGKMEQVDDVLVIGIRI